MKMKLFLNIVFLLFFLGGCATKKVVHTTENKTLVKERVVSYKDTTLIAPSSQTSLSIPLKTFLFHTNLKADKTPFKPTVFYQKNGNASARIIIKKDTVLLTANCDTIQLRAKIRQEIQKEFKSDKQIKSTEIIKSKGFSFWQLLLAITFSFVVGYLIKTFKIL